MNNFVSRNQSMQSHRLDPLFMQAPVAICIVSGATHIIEFVNDRMLEFLGRTRDVMGSRIESTLTEARQQGLIKILDTVRSTKQPYSVSNFPGVILINGVRETRYFNLIFTPYSLDDEAKEPDGIFCVAHNVTEQVLTLQKLEEEKQRTQIALESGELGMMSTHWKTNVVTADKRANEIFGLNGEHSFEDYLNRIHPDDRKLREEILAKVGSDGKYDFEVRLVMNDGSIKWMRSRGLLQKDIEGNTIGSFGVVQDVTAQKQFALALHHKVEERTKELEAQRNLLDSVLKNSSNGISVSRVIRDEQGTVIDAQTILANDAAVRFIGLPRNIYLTKKATEIEPGIVDTPYYKACTQTLETGEPFIMQYYLESTRRWLELTVSKLDDDHLIHVFTDVTSIKEAQLNLERSVENLQQTNAKLEEFTRVASHDLKEPIRKVRFFTDRLQSLLKDKLNDEEKNLFQRVDNAAQRMALLVDDLLAYSQLTDEASEQEDIDLNKKVKLILTDIELLVQEKGAVIETDNLPTIKANRRQMQQLFQNLITNALKYTKPNIPPRVTIRYKKIKGSEAPFTLPDAALPKDFHLIEVCDNGIGFPQSDADRIFNVFTRLHGNKEYPGTGIGLSIAKRVVENHHGFIYAKSQPGEGACFYVLLPVQ